MRVHWETEGFVSPACIASSIVWGWCNVIWTCCCDSRRFTRGLGWWRDVCHLKNVCLLWAVTVLWLEGSSFRLLFLRALTLNVIGFLVLLATVFESASAFNGDLSKWDVAKVTTISGSESIRIVENDLTWRELMLCFCVIRVYSWRWGTECKLGDGLLDGRGFVWAS